MQKYKIENETLKTNIKTIINDNKNAKLFKKVSKIKNNVCAVCNIYCKKKCANCKTEYYCCLEHQQQHWSSHKSICRWLAFNKSCNILKGEGGN